MERLIPAEDGGVFIDCSMGREHDRGMRMNASECGNVSAVILFLFIQTVVCGSPANSFTFEAGEISEIDLDVSNGFLFFKAADRRFYWYVTDGKRERLEAAVLVASQLRCCKSVDFIPVDGQVRKKKGLEYDLVSNLVIRLPPPD